MNIEEFEQRLTGELPQLLIEIRVKEKGFPVVSGITTGEDDPETWARVTEYVKGLGEILKHNREVCNVKASEIEAIDYEDRHKNTSDSYPTKS